MKNTGRKMAKRIGLICLMVVYIIVFTMPAALAYIDPSTTTYLIQAVVGIAVAVGSFVAVYWRRMKKKVAQKMGVDDEKNKIKEDEVVEVSDDSDKAAQ